MAKPTISGGAMPMSTASPLHALAPGNLAKLTPKERGRAMKRTKRVPAHAALTTPASILGK